jgi:hypothetical protein
VVFWTPSSKLWGRREPPLHSDGGEALAIRKGVAASWGQRDQLTVGGGPRKLRLPLSLRSESGDRSRRLEFEARVISAVFD